MFFTVFSGSFDMLNSGEPVQLCGEALFNGYLRSLTNKNSGFWLEIAGTKLGDTLVQCIFVKVF
jgi:hypothetical protein